MTIKYRRMWGDMIETYKIINRKYDNTGRAAFINNERP